MQARTLQKAAAQKFEESWIEEVVIDDENILKELLAEAAFRYWVYCIDFNKPPPKILPSFDQLLTMAKDLDTSFGSFTWWTWPIWNTCPICSASQAASCQECLQLASFAGQSTKWLERQTLRESLRRNVKYHTELLKEPRSKQNLRQMAAENVEIVKNLLDIDWSLQEEEKDCDFLDRLWGESVWWSWPAWYSCDTCYSLETPSCAACKQILAPYALDKQIEDI